MENSASSPSCNGRGQGRGTRGSSWSFDETKLLQKLWGEAEVKYAVSTLKRKYEIFAEISAELANLGYDRGPVECRNKTKVLRRDYKRAIASNKQSGNERAKFICYEEMDRIFRSDVSMHPLRTTETKAPEHREMSIQDDEVFTLELFELEDSSRSTPEPDILVQAFTRKQKRPPEVVVKLMRRHIRDSILQFSQKQEIKIKESKVNILKDVPWRVPQIRKEYSFLTTLLVKQNIRYKWIYPEDLTLQWEKKTQRLDSLKKARAFAEENADKLGYIHSSTPGTSSDEDAISVQTILETQAASGVMTALQKKDIDDMGEDKPERRLREKKTSKKYYYK
ncbi:hypothetical protein JRQ81_016492 [Phrynocephalus forsythii]|uniref:Myb/SANT-like DNA-binding domain-containing protein n=1 Tax=Phrynocephalus forsythii TaxID=171643 RepID=A0A9Q0XTA7_9SAUR|nr:hypothetical protein JRQ81_016492 [Phrynocephalus forsythii]